MKSILKPIDSIVGIKAKTIDPKEFFQDKKGLWVSSNFIDNVATKAEKMTKDKTFNVNSFELTANAYDREIEESFNDNHIFSETDVCALIAALIENQKKGEEGVLLNNGYFNIFYTPDRVVNVFWSSASQRWYVYVWRRGCRWFEGSRVFSPATVTLNSASEPLNSSLEQAIKTVKDNGYKVIKEM